MPSRRFPSWRPDRADLILVAVSWLLLIWTWIREGEVRQRLADVKVPNGILLPVVWSAVVRQRRTDRAIKEFAATTSEFGTFLGTRMRQSDARSKQLLELQASLEGLALASDVRDAHLLELQDSIAQLTRWLVVLTIVLGIIGLGGIAATLWAALR